MPRPPQVAPRGAGFDAARLQPKKKKRGRRPPTTPNRVPLLDGVRDEGRLEKSPDSASSSPEVQSRPDFFTVGSQKKERTPAGLLCFWSMAGITMFSAELLVSANRDAAILTSLDSSSGSWQEEVTADTAYWLPAGLRQLLKEASSRRILTYILYGCGGVQFVLLVVVCSQGHCALGTRRHPITKEATQTNRSFSPMRVLGWLGMSVVVFGLTCVPFIIFAGLNARSDPKNLLLWVSGVFALLAVLMGFWEIYQHLDNFYMPRLQHHLLKVLLMVPIYAVNAACVIKWPGRTETYLSAVRELWCDFELCNLPVCPSSAIACPCPVVLIIARLGIPFEIAPM